MLENKYRMSFKGNVIYKRLKESRLFMDSFWAVFGNGLGFGSMLLAGIIIARLLGKDLYGEYGMVKTTMFQVAAFATFGLGYTSTRFVSKAKTEKPETINGIVHSSFLITAISSTVLALLLIVLAKPLSIFIEEPSLALVFRLLGFITILKALLATQNGVLAGLGDFKNLARNNVISGLSLLVLCIPFTILFSVNGSLFALALSQLINLILNVQPLKNDKYLSWDSFKFTHIKELVYFSIPVALQELTFSASSWLTSLILVKMTTMGELGIYSATSQWNTIILFIPGLLSNVVLSHLSGTVLNENKHKKTILSIIGINLVCTLIPFLIVYLTAEFISGFYGPTFSTMPTTLRICVFSTIFLCVGEVLKSEMIAQGRNWTTLVIRSTRDIIGLVVAYLLLLHTNGIEGAKQVAISFVISGAYFLIALLIAYFCYQQKRRA